MESAAVQGGRGGGRGARRRGSHTHHSKKVCHLPDYAAFHTADCILSYGCRLRTQYELNHPLIVKLKDVILSPNYLNLVLELAEAGDLFRHTSNNLQSVDVPGTAGSRYKSIGEDNAR